MNNSKKNAFTPFNNIPRKLKIRSRVIVFVILSLLLFSVILLATTTLVVRSTVDYYVKDYIINYQKDILSGLDLYFKELTNISLKITTNQSIYKALLSGDIYKANEATNALEINKNLVSGFSIISDDFDLIYSYDSPDYSTDLNFFDFNEDFNELRNATNSSPVFSNKVIKMGDVNVFLCGLPMYNFYSQQRIGYLIIYINEAYLSDSFSSELDAWKNTYILSKSDVIVAHNSKERLGEYQKIEYNSSNNRIQIVRIEGQKNVIASTWFHDELQPYVPDWRIVSVISHKNLFHMFSQINKLIIIILFATMSLTIILSFFLSKKVTSSVKSLKTRITTMETKDGYLSFEKQHNDEIAELEKSFENLIFRVNNLIERNNEEKEKQRELELTALQAQINPHFLYNTLDTIGWIARIEKQENIETMISELSNFFRISLSSGRKLITVQEEIRIVQSYCIIEGLKRPNKFEVEYYIDESLNDKLMLKLCLQPLVENALKHGIYPKDGKGIVKIFGYEKEGDIYFEVIDNGVGFDTSKLTESGKKHSGYGLLNVYERIALEYGKEYSGKIESKIGYGTKCVLKLKLI